MSILDQKLKAYSAGVVLDVGTGRGNFIPVITQCFKDYTEITGIDMNDNQLKVAAESCKNKRAKFINMDASNMEFADNSFDTVCISNTLHHLPDRDSVLNEMKRVLKPEGLFIVSEMFCDNQTDKQMSHVHIHHINGEIDTLLGVYHDKTFKRQEIIDIMDRIGLNIVDVFDYNTPEEQADEEFEEGEKAFLDNAVQSLERRVEQVKDSSKYNDLKMQAERLKSIIYDTGFMGATELLIVAQK